MGLPVRVAVWLTVLVAGTAGPGVRPLRAQGTAPPPAPAPATATPTGEVAPPPLDADALARIKRRLSTGTPLVEAALDAPAPTFRTSVSEKIDIWKYWGDPAAVAAYVRPNGGTWHHEFQDMVTPDEFKGYGSILGNGEKLQLAATSLAFAGAMKLLGAGISQAKDAMATRARRKAKEEVAQELAAFCAANPGACPTAPPPP
jgi:hypothetical protein